MPGIAGFFLKEGGDFVSLAKNMAQTLSQNRKHHLSLYVAQDRGLALSRVGYSFPNLGPGAGLLEDEDIALVFDGELYGEHPSSDPLFLQKSLKERGLSALSELRGVFSLAVFEKGPSRLLLISDKFGLKPLYYTLVSQGVLFASEVKALLCHPGVSREPDMEALADFFYHGHLLGDRTPFRDIKLLSPGSVLILSEEGAFRVEPYWRLRELFVSQEEYEDGLLASVVEAFGEAVRKRLRFKEELGISLSGGLDSRAILAAMEEEARGIPSYTLGLKGCQDERFSAKMAQICGTRHVFVEITQEHLKDFLGLAETLIRLSDGMYHPHESTEKAALEYFRQAPFRILLRGHGGEIAKASLAYPVQPSRELLGLKDPKKAMGFIFQRANLVLRDVDPDKLFLAEELKRESSRAREALEEVLGEVAGLLHPVDLSLYYFIKEYIRRQAVASLAIFRSQVDIRLPFLDEDFLALLLRLPPQRRWSGEVHLEIIKRYRPALIKVPNSNTGAPLDAGPVRLFLTDKFNSLLKKLSLPGFRHYTEFDRWQREHFRETIKKILFAERTLKRGIYHPEGLRKVYEAHVSGQRNYAHLLGTMVGVELWFRNFVD